LAGESEEEYQANLENWLTSLEATTPVLVDLAARIADVSYRQERVRRHEEAILAGHIQAKTAVTLVGAKLVMAREAFMATQGLILLAEGVVTIMPASEILKLVPAMNRVVEAALASDVSFALVHALGTSVEAVTADAVVEVEPSSFQALARACKAVLGALKVRISELDVEVVRERERIGREVFFSDLPEIRRLGPVRARLARELDQAMDAFKKARELVSLAHAAEPASSQPCKVELHVVGRP